MSGLRMEGVKIRRLQTSDAAELTAFYNGLSSASKRTFRPLGATTTEDTCRAIAGDNMEAAGTKYDLVALLDGQIIGWSFIWRLDTPEPVFGLAVADAYHHRSLGAALMEQVMGWARTAGLPRVYLTVVTDNLVAKRLYEKFNFSVYGEFVGEDGLPYYKMYCTV